jgi:hypothetical protein
LHNVYLKFFYPKNTISCGFNRLEAKPIVARGFAADCAVCSKFRPCFAAAEP